MHTLAVKHGQHVSFSPPSPPPCPQPTPLKHISCRNSISRLCWPTQRTAGASARSCEIVSGLDCALDPLAKYRIPAEVGITGFHNCWFIPVGTCTTKKKDRRNTLRNHVLSRSWHFSCISFPPCPQTHSSEHLSCPSIASRRFCSGYENATHGDLALELRQTSVHCYNSGSSIHNVLVAME